MEIVSVIIAISYENESGAMAEKDRRKEDLPGSASKVGSHPQMIP